MEQTKQYQQKTEATDAAPKEAKPKRERKPKNPDGEKKNQQQTLYVAKNKLSEGTENDKPKK